ncbi:response regulator transcription factor [Spongiivirga citrea]|uniref:DNA-binding response regulator n=1 Tax=Spongiivirga citrea TaxID=1481457 RepID=A0A6M0CHB5_9FLAO|nr:response regulator transcription factor [Spongiivirga citrea]NER16902.1 DNA-binding response regulator [Spongiivirga citrea]
MEMNNNIKILIVDDHPMIIEGYKNSLLNREADGYNLLIESANDCDLAVNKITASITSPQPFKVLFVDINLPPSANGEFLSGEDIAKFAKLKIPNSKVVILTMHGEDQRIGLILKNVDPDGLLIKTDVGAKEFVDAFRSVLKDEPYYSASVMKHLRRRIQYDFELDIKNQKILEYLSKGIPTSDITDMVGLSRRAVVYRKGQLKQQFGITDASDAELIEKAKSLGFV